MKKKYLYGAAIGLVALIIIVFTFVWLGLKCSLSVSAEQGYTVTVKDVKLDDNGKASVRKGDKLVFAVALDKDYSDSNIKVKVNDTEVVGEDGVYRYTVEKDTTIDIEGVTKNDYIVQGIDVDPGTLDGQEFTLLRDENKRPIPVLKDISMNSVDTYDVPSLELTAYVMESINPGWRYRELSDVNLGKYTAAKFYVKHTNYLQAKTTFSEEFYVNAGSNEWHEFLFQNDEGVMSLYIDGNKVSSCNYLSDILLCLQDEGSYKFSNIYVIPRDDYEGGQLTVVEGDGYYFDILPREYAIGAIIKFHVMIDDSFQKSDKFAVKAGNQVLEAAEDGSYTFTFSGDTKLTVTGVVPKPLDSAYRVIGIPMHAQVEETTNYAIMQSIKGAKTYAYTQKIWGALGFAGIDLKQYNNLLFFMKKDDTDSANFVEILQKADDGTVTPYFQNNDSIWHKVEIKKESGQMYMYIDGVRNDTPIIDAEHLNFVLNTGSQFRITSLLGIEDKKYVAPAPDYISSAYITIGSPLMMQGKEIDNYELVKRTEDAKTYQYTTEQWGSYGFADVNFDKYKSLLFFMHKEDMNLENFLEFYKADVKNAHLVDYVINNDNKWYKIELKKVSAGKFDVYVNNVKHNTPVESAEQLKITLNADSVFMYTSLFGIPDLTYVEPAPDYISSKYQTITSPVAVIGKEIDNYVLVEKTEDAKTYQYTTAQWGTIGFADVDFDKYESLLFFVHKDDVAPQNFLEFYKADDKNNHLADYIINNDNKWYKIELKKNSAGAFDVYVNDVKHDTPVERAEQLKFTLNEKSVFMYTSLFGISDPNYVPEEPEYISSEYSAIAPTVPLAGTEITNYPEFEKVSGAKTYEYTTEQWGSIGFANVELEKYSSLIFFVQKKDQNPANWLEFWRADNAGGHAANYIANNDNKLYQVELKKNQDDLFDVYINGTKQEGPVSDTATLRFTLNGNSTIHYTSLCGILDPNYEEETPDYLSSDYKPIVSAVAVEGTEIENYVSVSQIEDAKTYKYVTPQWGAINFAEVNLAKYQQLAFYVHKEDTNENNWLEFYQVDDNAQHVADYIQTNDNAWYKVEFIKDAATGQFYVSVDGVKHAVMVSDIAKLKFTLNENSELHFTSLFGILDPEYKEPVEKGTMIVVSPWAYGQGSLVNEQTYKDAGYEYATTVQGSGDLWTNGALLMDVDMSIYESFRFALKSTDGKWWEIGSAAENKWDMIAGNESSWTEYEFKNEGDGYFHLYKNGNETNVVLSENINLAELQMKFADSGTLYLTEVRGELKEGASSALQVIAPSFNGYEGTLTESEMPNRLSGGSIKVTTTWTATQSPLADIALGQYSKLLFYARQYEGSGWFESDYLGTEQLKDGWTEFKLMKNADGTWNLYRSGRVVTSNVSLANLKDVTAKYGDGNYYFSQVFGVYDANPEPETRDVMVVTSPWAYYKGNIDNTQTYAEGGYEYATLIKGENDAYAGAMMKDVDLSIYSELRFALKTNGNYWYEIGMVADNSWNKVQKADASWVEIKFVDEGNNCFQAFVNDGWINWQIPLDSNLSDLQMKFSSDTNGVLCMTELRGTVKADATSSLKVVADSFNTKTGTTVETERPNAVATKSTEVVTTWDGTQTGFTSVDLSRYDKIVFYARKAGSDEKAGWFESARLGSFVMEYNWTEFKLVKNADGTWNVYTGGRLQQSKQALTNLSDVTATYGDNHYYFSEVFGVEGESSSPEQGGNENPSGGEHIVLDMPWSYAGGSADDTQTYTDGGYEKATVISGSLAAYLGAKMNAADLSGYKEFRFALKTNGNYWYEIGMVADNSWNKVQKADASWVEIKFVDEGNNCFQAFVNGSWVNWQLPLDANFSDIQMKFSENGAGILYLTEVRGTSR